MKNGVHLFFFEHWGDTFLMVNKTSEAEKTYKKSAESGNTGQNLSVKLSKF